jgi:hypothetical protein
MAWNRLQEWNQRRSNPTIMAVVETSPSGFIVSVRYDDEGHPGDIVSGRSGSAVANRRTVEAAFDRAMDVAEDQGPPPPSSRGPSRRR